MDYVFQHAKLRYFFPLIVIGFTLPFVLVYFANPDLVLLDLDIVILEWVVYFLPLALLWATWCYRYPMRDVWGELPQKADIRQLAMLSIPMIGMSLFAYYAFFYPLSFIFPEAITEWVTDVPEIIIPLDRPDAIIVNILTAFSAIIAAPIVEELIFRGFLFGRLNYKYGLLIAILLPSVLFGVLHSDPIDAFIFAVFMTLIRIKYNSIIAPIIVHMANNAIAIVLDSVDVLILKTTYEYTLDEFRSFLWLGLVGGVIGLPWLYRYFKQELEPVVRQYRATND